MNQTIETLIQQFLFSTLDELPEIAATCFRMCSEMERSPTFSSPLLSDAWLFIWSWLFCERHQSDKPLYNLIATLEAFPKFSKTTGELLNFLIRKKASEVSQHPLYQNRLLHDRISQLLDRSELLQPPLITLPAQTRPWEAKANTTSSMSIFWVDESNLGNLKKKDIERNCLLFPQTTTLAQACAHTEWIELWLQNQLSIFVLDHPILLQREAQKLSKEKFQKINIVLPEGKTLWIKEPNLLIQNLIKDFTGDVLRTTRDLLHERLRLFQKNTHRLLPQEHKFFHLLLDYTKYARTSELDVFSFHPSDGMFSPMTTKTIPLLASKSPVPKILHIIDQFNDTPQHIYSALLHILISSRNKREFDHAVLSLELPQYLSKQNPYSSFGKTGSEITGKKIINFLKMERIPHGLNQTDIPINHSITSFIARINRVAPDILLFYGDNPLHVELAHQFPTVKKILILTSSVYLQNNPFDHVISSFGKTTSTETVLHYPMFHHPCLRIFSMDQNSKENALPPKKIGSFFVATHLSKCSVPFSSRFISLLDEMLKNMPRMILVIYGQLNKKALNEHSDLSRWGERIIFTNTEKEHALLSNIKIYLNPFPFGSKEELLLYISNGCPIVTLNDAENQWNPRAIAAHHWCSDELISSSPEEYLKTVFRLYCNAKHLTKEMIYGSVQARINREASWYAIQVENVCRKILQN